MTLASSDPFDKPLLNPNYLSSDFDVLTMVHAIKDMQTFMSTGPWKDFVIGPIGALVNSTTDEQLQFYARNTSESISHSIGTARMSPFGADWGVVNPDLSVKGTHGLSVVDASIFVCIEDLVVYVPHSLDSPAFNTGMPYTGSYVYCCRTSC